MSETEAATDPTCLLPRIYKSFWKDVLHLLHFSRLCPSVSQLLIPKISRDPSGMTDTCLLLAKLRQE